MLKLQYFGQLIQSDVQGSLVWLIWNDLDIGKDWRQEEKGMTEDETVGWHRLVNRHEFGQTPGKPGVLQSMGLKRVGHDLETEKVYYQRSN